LNIAVAALGITEGDEVIMYESDFLDWGLFGFVCYKRCEILELTPQVPLKMKLKLAGLMYGSAWLRVKTLRLK